MGVTDQFILTKEVLFMSAFCLTAMAAEETTDSLEKILTGLTREEILAGGTVLGLTIGTAVTIGVIWFILQVAADWKIFKKAGRPGWKSIIPILNYYEEFDLSWKGRGIYGVIYALLMIFEQAVDYVTVDPTPGIVIFVILVAGILGIVLIFKQSMRLARSFGKSTGFGLGLFFLGPVFRLILGFGSAEYIGAQD